MQAKSAVVGVSLLLVAAFGAVAEEETFFQVRIEQDGVQMEIRAHTVALEKRRFTLVLLYAQPMGVLVNFSVKPTLLGGMKKGKTVEEIVGDPGRFMGMAETSFNPEEGIFLDEIAPHYLYVDESDHRFSEVIVGDDHLECRRAISKAQYVASHGPAFPIEQLDSDVLYLAFVYSVWGENWESITKQQDYLKIVFE